MKWEMKDKLQKIFFTIFIIVFIIIMLWAYQNCQRRVVENVFFGGVDSMVNGVCNKLSNGQCFRSSVGRAADL